MNIYPTIFTTPLSNALSSICLHNSSVLVLLEFGKASPRIISNLMSQITLDLIDLIYIEIMCIFHIIASTWIQ